MPPVPKPPVPKPPVPKPPVPKPPVPKPPVPKPPRPPNPPVPKPPVPKPAVVVPPVVEPVVLPPPTHWQFVWSHCWLLLKQVVQSKLVEHEPLVPVVPVVLLVPLVVTVVAVVPVVLPAWQVWLVVLQVWPALTLQQPVCGVVQRLSATQPSLHTGAPPSGMGAQYQAGELLCWLWHWLSEVQPDAPVTQWPLVVSQMLGLTQSLCVVQGPQVPPTQPRPLQLEASVQLARATHWPLLSQFSLERQSLFLVQAPQWPGLPE